VGTDPLFQIGQRLAHVRGVKSQADFAKELGIHKNTLGAYERIEREISATALARLVDIGWNANWLLTGEGPERMDQLLRVAEEGAAYSGSQDLRERALRIAIEMIDEALAAARKELSTPQRAEAYVLLADLIMDEEDLPNAKVVQLAIKSVAQG
jgi:transcriptional regulator with XRE-family HTH domain